MNCSSTGNVFKHFYWRTSTQATSSVSHSETTLFATKGCFLGKIPTGFAPDETTTKPPYLDRDEATPPREIRARIYFTDNLYDDAYKLLGNDDSNRTFEDEVNSRLGEVRSGDLRNQRFIFLS